MSTSDLNIFAHPDFDADEYANTVLAGEPYPPTATVRSKTPARPGALPPAKEDISVAITKLDSGIEDVSKQLKGVVNHHHEALLVRAAGISDLRGSLGTVRFGLDELDGSLEKLRVKIRQPYQTLDANVSRLEKLQQAADVLRRTARFVILARRLELQMAELGTGSPSYRILTPTPGGADTPLGTGEDEKERAIAKAALSIAELMALLDASEDGDPRTEDGEEGLSGSTGVPLRSVDAIAAHVPAIEDARAKVTGEMETMVLNGLTHLNQALLASSLQTAHNLRVLPDLVQNLVAELSEAVETRIKRAFDVSQIAKEILAKEPPTTTAQSILYKSRIRTEPTNITAPQWNAALWPRLELMIEEMAGCCIKVYTLEKVLKLRRDHVSQVVFLDEAMKVLEDKPSLSFWHALARALEKQAKDATKSSTFLQQTLSSNYPKFLRLFHDFFAKIAVHTDTAYTQAQQSPETILVLRALSTFETLYLSKSSIRLNEAVGQAFVGGARSPPGINEGVNMARAVANELDTAKFDPLLVKAVAKNAVASLDLMISRADALVTRDRNAVTLLGPTATTQQMINAQLATCLYQCRARLEKLRDDHSEVVFSVLAPSLEKIDKAYQYIVQPILTAIRKDLSAIIARVHRVDLSKSMDAPGALGAGPSVYMRDLVEKLTFVKTEILAQFVVGDASRQWHLGIVRHVIRTFVLHMSIARPLGESGKLQLTTDMTELEFALSAFQPNTPQGKRGSSLQALGADYLTLRAMRPLLFLDNALLTSPQHTAGVPPLIVLHHVLVRSPIPLPHALHGWQEAEYVRWVDEHTPEEALALVEGAIAHWERIAEAEGNERPEAAEYIRIARSVLVQAQDG